MKNVLKTNGLLIGVATLVVFFDQLTKTLVRQHLALGESWMPLKWLEPFARIVHWHNTGAAFGIFQNGNLVLKVLSMVIAIAILFYFQKIDCKETLARVALSMQFGGALGNLVDRFKLGHVTDFISVGTFPVFNVADANVTVGVALLVLAIILQERKTARSLESTSTAEVEKNGEQSNG